MTTTRRRPQVPMAQRRAEITEAALRVMRRGGAWNLTTRAVAQEADVPHGAVHYAFSSKEALLKAVIAADTESAQRIFARWSEFNGTPEDILRQVAVAYAHNAVSDPETELVLQELTLLSVRSPVLKPAMQESNDAYLRGVVEMLQGIAERFNGSWAVAPDVIAQEVLDTIFGASVAWLLDRDDARYERVLVDNAIATAARFRHGSSQGRCL